jgi:hypothetical protein
VPRVAAAHAPYGQPAPPAPHRGARSASRAIGRARRVEAGTRGGRWRLRRRQARIGQGQEPGPWPEVPVRRGGVDGSVLDSVLPAGCLRRSRSGHGVRERVVAKVIVACRGVGADEVRGIGREELGRARGPPRGAGAAGRLRADRIARRAGRWRTPRPGAPRCGTARTRIGPARRGRAWASAAGTSHGRGRARSGGESLAAALAAGLDHRAHRRASASGPGTRGSSCASGCWAETSASRMASWGGSGPWRTLPTHGGWKWARAKGETRSRSRGARFALGRNAPASGLVTPRARCYRSGTRFGPTAAGLAGWRESGGVLSGRSNNAPGTRRRGHAVRPWFSTSVEGACGTIFRIERIPSAAEDITDLSRRRALGPPGATAPAHTQLAQEPRGTRGFQALARACASRRRHPGARRPDHRGVRAHSLQLRRPCSRRPCAIRTGRDIHVRAPRRHARPTRREARSPSRRPLLPLPEVVPSPRQRDRCGSPGHSSNPRYTFDQFVIGASNRFAHAAALSVA